MKLLFHRVTLVCAVLDNDIQRLDAIAEQLAATEEYCRLQALGSCPGCAASVADANTAPPKQ